MNSQEILSLYEAVADITDQMLVAARAGDWGNFISLESHCAAQVKLLEQDEPPVALTGTNREKKVKIIHKILSDDREIRNVTEPWLGELSKLIQSAGTERKLSQTYGVNQGN